MCALFVKNQITIYKENERQVSNLENRTIEPSTKSPAYLTTHRTIISICFSKIISVIEVSWHCVQPESYRG